MTLRWIKPAFLCRFITTLQDRAGLSSFQVLFGQQSPSPTTSGTALIETLSFMDQWFSHRNLGGFPWISRSFCQFLPVNPPNISPKIVPMVSPQNDGSTRGKNIVTSPTKVPKQAEITKKTSKGGIVQNSQTQKRTLWKHTRTISKTPGVFLKSFRHFLRFFSFLGPSWSTLIRRVKCLNKRRSKWAGPGLNACQAVTVQKTLYATCFKGDTWDLGDLPMMTNIFRTNLGDI